MTKIKLPPISDEDRQHLSYNPNTDDLVDWITEYATQSVIEDRAQRDADHLAELRAYELTVANLREQLAQQAPQVPMTDDEIIEYFDEVSPKLGFGLDDLRAFTSGAVCAQSHHNIKEQP